MWAIEMSPLEERERERLVKTAVLWSSVGILMALAVATVLVYEEAPVDRHQTAAIPNDRAAAR